MFKRIVIPVLIVLSLFSIYFGAYKPLAKAQIFINNQRHLSNANSYNELIGNFEKVFSFSSPIGQREVVKFASNQFEGMIQDKNQPEIVSRSLVEYIEKYIFKNDVVQLLQIGSMYQVLYDRFNKEEYLDKAEGYYKRVNEIGPKLPHALYALFNLYKKSGQIEKMNEIGGEILELWPSDENIKKIINE